MWGELDDTFNPAENIVSEGRKGGGDNEAKGPTRGVDLLGELVDGHVGGCTHQDLLAGVQPRQIVHDGGAGHRLAGSRWTLNQRQRPL